jgi:replicative DNA helicase
MEPQDWLIHKMIKRPSSIMAITETIKEDHFSAGIRRDIFINIVTYLEKVEKRNPVTDAIVTDKNGKPETELRFSPTLYDLIEGDSQKGEYVSKIMSYDELSNKDVKEQIRLTIKNAQIELFKRACSSGIAGVENCEDLDTLKDEVVQLLNYATMDQTEKPFIDQSEAVDEFYSFVQSRMEAGNIHKISTGFSCFDYLLHGGFERGEFPIIASATGQGKSILAAQILNSFTDQGLKVGLLGLEMNHREYVKRQWALLASYGRSPHDSRFQNMSQSAFDDIDIFKKSNVQDRNDILSELKNKDIYYLKPKQINVAEMKKYFHILVTKFKVDVICLDHILLVDSKQEERLKVLEIANYMKSFAAEHNVLCLAVAQMNRETDLKDPKVTDLSGGRSLEHAATALLTIGHPKEEKQVNKFADTVPVDDYIRELRLIKSRNSGSERSFRTRFFGDDARFKEILPDNWSDILQEKKYNTKLIY